MHGRIKVRTSEEEKARKEKERQEKLKVFKHAMQKIQHKRINNELDKDLLDLTGKVLSSNPDIYTLWNIRREILINLRDNSEIKEELPQLYDSELTLTEYCLKMNPKSYCAWHQREWVLTTRPDPDWKKELDLCNTYLKLDERNFHTWDYRRFVVSQCKPPLEDEFDFTTEKLHVNFSNYSAWHYRSKMLVELYPDVEGGRPIEDSHHKHELKMVINAAFTDPDDTSAWFYQRWLLGLNASSEFLTQLQNSIPLQGAVKKTTKLVVCTVTASKISVAFNDSVSRNFVTSKTQLFFNDTRIIGDWVSCSGNDYDVVWILKHGETITGKMDIRVEFEKESGEKNLIRCLKHHPTTYVGKSELNFQKKYSEPVIEELKTQLESCRQLLILEPDSKWTLLTTTIFLYCINSNLYHKEIVANLHVLKTIDKLRGGYYDDFITKACIEEQLYKDYSKTCLDLKITFGEIITSLPRLQYYSYCENVDLSNQYLTSKVLPSLIVLQHCKKLSLGNNKLTTLKGFPALHLEELNLEGNEALSEKEVVLFKENHNKCKVIFK